MPLLVEIARRSCAVFNLPRFLCNHADIGECFSGIQYTETRRHIAYSAETYWADTLHFCSYINLHAVDRNIIDFDTTPPTPSNLGRPSAILGGVESLGSNSLRSPFQLHRRISTLIDPMHILNYWRPQKVEKHGIKRMSAARKLLENHIAELSPSNRDRAESLLNYAEDLRQIRRERTLMAQFKRARRYDKDTGEVLHIIECMLAQL